MGSEGEIKHLFYRTKKMFHVRVEEKMVKIYIYIL